MRTLASRLVLGMVLVAAPGLAGAGPGDGAAKTGPKPTPATTGPRPTPAATAKATLDRWLAAQNGGSYADYAALYAPSFAGVKRVGKVTKKMNRAAWLKDRKAMFRAPMKVGAGDVTITPPPDATTGSTIELTQTWASGAFADTGPKRIVLDPTDTLIVAEELLSSRPMLTDAACILGLYPGASVKKKLTGADDGARPIRDVDVREVGARWLCKVTVEREGGYDATLGLFDFGTKWSLKGRLELDYDEAAAVDDSGESSDGEVSVEPLALHATIPVVQVVKVARKSGPEYSDTASSTAIYRVDGDAFVELLSWEDGGSTGEADDVKTCELAVESRRTAGWPDLTLTCTRRQVQWAAGETDPTETHEKTRYRWDGSTYAER